MSEEQVQRFAPANGRVSGIAGFVVTGIVVAIWVADRSSVPAPMLAGALLLAAVCWAALLRPRVWVSDSTLSLRNMVTTFHIPLAAVNELALRHVLAVSVGSRRYVCAGLGRKLARGRLSNRPSRAVGLGLPGSQAFGQEPVVSREPADRGADFAEEIIRQRVSEDRRRRGVAARSPEALALASEVRRELGWVEIVTLGGTLVALVVTILV